MKILHLPESFFPYSLGGKEVYCLNMMHRLNEEGHSNIVAIHAPNSSVSEGIEFKDGFKVFVLPSYTVENEKLNWYTSLINSKDQLVDFKNLLVEEAPDQVIFHDQNGGASLTHMRIVKAYGKAKTAMVFHSPGQMCLNRQLLFRLERFCEIKLNAHDCAKCKLISLNRMDTITSGLLAFLPNFKVNVPGINSSFYSPKYLSQQYIDSTQEFYETVDTVYYHAQWVKDHLLKNGVNENKLHYWSLPDIMQTKVQEKKQLNFSGREVQIALIGRPTWIKGAHLLVQALRILPKSYNVKVHILGRGWLEDDYGKSLYKQIENDDRYLEPKEIKNAEMNEYLKQIDLCVIPSVWPETGPISVLDALENGLQILGADLAGIRELSKKYNFPIFKWNDSVDLCKKLKEIIDNNG